MLNLKNCHNIQFILFYNVYYFERRYFNNVPRKVRDNVGKKRINRFHIGRNIHTIRKNAA